MNRHLCRLLDFLHNGPAVCTTTMLSFAGIALLLGYESGFGRWAGWWDHLPMNPVLACVAGLVASLAGVLGIMGSFEVASKVAEGASRVAELVERRERGRAGIANRKTEVAPAAAPRGNAKEPATSGSRRGERRRS